MWGDFGQFWEAFKWGKKSGLMMEGVRVAQKKKSFFLPLPFL